MAEEPYFTPGQSDGVPPQSPTEFSPAKPLGPDPVSPLPAPEGSSTEQHAQLFAFDASAGQFKPVSWKDGGVQVGIDPFYPILDTFITRDPNSGLVSLIAETDGVRTKNTIFTRNPPGIGRVVSIHEVVV